MKQQCAPPGELDRLSWTPVFPVRQVLDKYVQPFHCSEEEKELQMCDLGGNAVVSSATAGPVDSDALGGRLAQPALSSLSWKSHVAHTSSGLDAYGHS